MSVSDHQSDTNDFCLMHRNKGQICGIYVALPEGWAVQQQFLEGYVSGAVSTTFHVWSRQGTIIIAKHDYNMTCACCYIFPQRTKAAFLTQGTKRRE